MSTEIKTWQVIDGKLQPVNTSLAAVGRKETQDLEEWIASQPAIIGTGITIIGRQVPTKSGPLDLLGIDKHGNTVVIELKRDRLPREALAQAIDYASDVADWSIEKLSEICTQYTGKSLADHLIESFPDISLGSVDVLAKPNQRSPAKYKKSRYRLANLSICQIERKHVGNTLSC